MDYSTNDQTNIKQKRYGYKIVAYAQTLAEGFSMDQGVHTVRVGKNRGHKVLPHRCGHVTWHRFVGPSFRGWGWRGLWH